ncbi:MAG: glycerophosphodiester phosphodiesterase family protein [Acidobacteriota bacterium]
MAHRGAKKFAPENTLAAIQKAVELGMDFAEVDVQSTRDGHLVLMHDPDVDRTTDGRGFVYDMSLGQVKALDAGARFHAGFKGVRVPTLEEAFDAARGQIQLCIHWKDATPEALARSFEQAHAWDSAVVLGSAGQVAALRRVDPRIRVITDVYSLTALEAVVQLEDRPYGVSPSLSWLNAEVVAECHAAGIIVFADLPGPVEDCVQIVTAVEMGVDVVQTDDPDAVLRCLDALVGQAGIVRKQPLAANPAGRIRWT